ncbi:galactosylgalactosylxylosylprotein 3-beta-glucuronosyltransferase S-like isoform X2 [Hetaerina americana]|uniref:galactosylgalactosylxylosylprotein 3-beta-glucuronosyltransferase S-like isoform X2 n=2 Tax=Hetaerina americana TaxID=62018 RepID=UPI003A7F281E
MLKNLKRNAVSTAFHGKIICLNMRFQNMFLFTMMMMITVLYFVWISQGKETRKISTREYVFTCHVSFEDGRNKNQDGLQTIYFVTPTYPRREQAAELTRVGHTLMHVPNLHWIVADDNSSCNDMILKLLKNFGIPFTYMASPMPSEYRKLKASPRGVSNRRAAMNWIRKNANGGVLYFGDDDNTFDLKLFEEIRGTNKVSMFPVGLIGDFGVSAPVVKNGKVVGFFDSWTAKRKFAVDMAGFAVSVNYLMHKPNATMPYKAGYEEDLFLRSLEITYDEIEPKAKLCSQVLVWHTQTKKKNAPTMKFTTELDTSLKELLQELEFLGMGRSSKSEGIKTFMSSDGRDKVL